MTSPVLPASHRGPRRDVAGTSGQDLVDRDASTTAIHDFLDAVARVGATLVLRGDPGLGKSSLLEVAEARALTTGFRVVRDRGTQPPGTGSFGTVRRLLSPLGESAGRLAEAHQAALGVVLDGVAGTPPGRGTLGTAVVSLLRSAAIHGPVLLVVDDAQWLDQASSDILAFVGRRLAGTRAGLLVATEPSSEGFADPDIGQHVLVPLDASASRELLDRKVPQLAPQVRRRVLAEAGGNPLALLELAHLRAPAPGADRARARAEVLRIFGPRVEALPESTRDLLLLHALEGSGGIAVLSRITGEDVLAAAVPAERTGLIRIDEHTSRLEFLHPLVVTTLVELTGLAERQRAHSRIAQALFDYPERQVWHLAAAVTGPDETVAGLLENQARAAMSRGETKAAVRLLRRSAELSATVPARARRQVNAASIEADVTGDLSEAARLFADAGSVQTPLTPSLPAAVAASHLLLNAECEVDTAHALLVEAIEAHPGRHDADDPILQEALLSLLMMSWFGGRPTLWVPFRRAAERLQPRVPELVDLCHRTFGDPVHQAADALGELGGALRQVDTERDPSRITRLGLACVYTDRIGECRQALRRVIDDGREGGAVALAINALVTTCVDDWVTGQWDDAVARAAEGVALCQRHGYRRYAVILSGYIDQLVRVARGDLDGGAAAAAEMAAWAAERGAGMSTVFAEHLYTLRALALGDHEAAYRHVTRIGPPGELGPYQPHALWVLFDLVEAATRTQRHDEAAAHVAAMAAARIGEISPRLRMVQEGCTALVAKGEEAAEHFASALAVPDGGRWPFDRARIELAYGEHLHRTRDAAARRHLAQAAAVLHALGARPWEARAAAALRASGGAPEAARRVQAPALTVRERQIAELAARGLSNRDIGEQLFLSPRSVGAALYRVFPKLGITSRAALAAALPPSKPPAPAGDETPTRPDPGAA